MENKAIPFRTKKPDPKANKPDVRKLTRAAKKTPEPPALQKKSSKEEPTPSPFKSSTGHKFFYI
ncbi:hypothetical protein DSO57_1017999 [Entomophthora muscae]|uniref:Uncharacterized protein n=1 Tax=Entomophthora muscae TaxID=34485 RepID=A0ACC2STG9_9FUNG|nr:hypothetical protein DSO57_1017999 [Entomophthora muscae]